jgi:predicted exporter
VALGAWLVLVAACLMVISRTAFRTDMGAFLPRSAPLAEQTLTAQATKGAASHLVLLAIDGAAPPVLAALSEGLATRLRAQTPFLDVMNGDDASTAAIQKFVWRNRYMLSADVTPDRFTETGLHTALVNDLGLLGSDMGSLIQQSFGSDPTGEVLGLLGQLGGGQGPAQFDGVWVSPDGSSALLLVHTRAPGFDIDAQAQALTLIESDFNHVPGAGTARLRITGPGEFAVKIQNTTKRDVTWLSLLATAGAVSLLVFAYRSPVVLLLGLLPVATGALAAVAAVSLAFGFVHGITLGFGVTLIGESLDYAVYLFTQTARGETAQDTLSRIWPTLRLGMLTSVAGFCAMLFSDFTGFAQLGLFSIVGLVVAAGVTRLVLPHLLPTGFFAPGADFLARPLRAIIKQPRVWRWVLGTAVLASSVALAAHRGGMWDNDLANLSPIPAADQALNQTLRHDFSLPDTRYFVVLKAPDEQSALRESEALAVVLDDQVGANHLSGFDVPSAILPSDAAQRARQAALPDDVLLRTRFAQAGAELPFRPDSFTPFFHDVAAAKAAPLLDPASLPPALRLRLDSMLVKQTDGWVVMAPLRRASDPAGVAQAVMGVPETEFVDLDRQSELLLRKFQTEAVTLALAGSAAIFLLLLAGLRSPRRVLIVAAPLAASVLITAAVLTFGSGKLSIFMVVGFLLIVAVSSNYCLFFERMQRETLHADRALASIVLANLCTVAAYGLMAMSKIPVLHDMGLTVAMGTFLSLVCAAVLRRA